jgi:monoamine oxidase
VLSALVPPERYAVLLGTPPALRVPELLAEIARMYGSEALTPIATYLRFWAPTPGLRVMSPSGYRAT